MFTSLCFAQDHYALVEVLIKNDAGLVFIMNTITKTPNKESCDRILYPASLLKDKYPVRTACVVGPEWDKRFGDAFANKPTAALYISYRDPNGYATRINTKMLAGADSPTPGRPVDPPLGELMAWANTMIDTLEKGGVKNAKIIYPRKEKK
ncbi:MAG: hypothetical protein COV73_01880 [Candidatus Omnitrophica bacterium CG11_big_fil_rev_8_21_14_0_20_43_6]|nr:MAG: hypothetical protein COV73_01880 [Candidatus Omnitrophica bacterium CG11_big_fil_rev_8_21_14_0_20_43_6]